MKLSHVIVLGILFAGMTLATLIAAAYLGAVFHPSRPPDLPVELPAIASRADGAEQRALQWQAWGAIVSAVVSVLTLMVIGGTLITTIKMLDAANQTVAATRDIGQKQTRAYLAITKHTERFIVDDASGKISVSVRNSGNSPALNAELVVRLLYLSKDTAPRATARWIVISLPNLQAGEEILDLHHTFSWKDEYFTEQSRMGFNHTSVLFTYCVFADDVFDEEISAFEFSAVIPPSSPLYGQSAKNFHALRTEEWADLMNEHRDRRQKSRSRI